MIDTSVISKLSIAQFNSQTWSMTDRGGCVYIYYQYLWVQYLYDKCTNCDSYKDNVWLKKEKNEFTKTGISGGMDGSNAKISGKYGLWRARQSGKARL